MRDRFRDPPGWLIDKLPWPLRKLCVAVTYRLWPWDVWDSARYIGFRRPPQAVIDRARELAEEHGW